VLLLYVLKPVIMPLLFAILLAAIVFPVVNFLLKKCHLGHGLTSLLGVFIISFFVIAAIVIVINQFNKFSADSQLYIDKFSEIYYGAIYYIEEKTMLDASFLKNLEMPQFSAVWARSGDSITQAFSSASSFLADMLMVPLYMFFILYYRTFLVEFVYRAFPTLSHERMNAVLGGLYDVVQNYLRGLLLVMFIVGVLNSIGLLILGVDNAVFFGFLAASLMLIPYIGIFIGSLLPALVALVTKDSYWYAVAVIAIFAFVQFLESNFITPKITGSKMSMNAFISIVSLFVFGMLWGTIGLVLALPLTAMLKVIFDHSDSLKAWGFLIGETDDYHTKKSSMRWMNMRMRHFKKNSGGNP
jgi:predicted PurR-regulated permease PerM